MVLAGIALLASVVLVARHRPLLFPVIALVVSSLEVLRALGVAHLSVAKIPLALVFGAALAVAGVGVFARSGDKSSIAAATALVLVGGLQVLAAIHLH
jgi:hypothetical protein